MLTDLSWSVANPLTWMVSMLVVEACRELLLELWPRSGLLMRRLKNSEAASEAVSTRRLFLRL